MDLTGMNVYLSGPMAGRDHNNAEGFARAHAIVRDLGAREVYDPAMEWLTAPPGVAEARDHDGWMLRSVHELTRPGLDGPHYDLLVSLPTWYASEGASHERDVAEHCGIECVDLDSLTMGLE